MGAQGRPTGEELAAWRTSQAERLRAKMEGQAQVEAIVEQAVAAMLLEGELLADDARVVRGGVSAVETLVLNARTTKRRWGRPGVSCFASDALSTAQLVEAARFEHSTLRKTTAGALRRAGFELEATLDPPHFTIWLDEDADVEAECSRLEQCFGPVERKHD